MGIRAGREAGCGGPGTAAWLAPAAPRVRPPGGREPARRRPVPLVVSSAGPPGRPPAGGVVRADGAVPGAPTGTDPILDRLQRRAVGGRARTAPRPRRPAVRRDRPDAVLARRLVGRAGADRALAGAGPARPPRSAPRRGRAGVSTRFRHR